MTDTYYPVYGRMTLYSYNHHREPYRITATALTDLPDEPVEVSNWKINDARTEVTLTLVDYGPDDRTYPCEVKETALPSPGRSFRWSEFSACWIHKKTGVRVVNK